MVLPLTWNEEGVTECAFVTRVFYRGEAIDQLQLHVRGGLGDGMGSFSSPSLSKTSDGSGAALSHSELSTGNGAMVSQPSPSTSSSKQNGGVPYALGKAGSAGSPSKAFALSADEGTYRIITVCFDSDGNVIAPAGVCGEYDTGSVWPTFSIVKPAVDNTRVDMSPYGQSVFADAVDAIQAVDLAFDSLIGEVELGRMRIFLSDVMFDKETTGRGKRVSIPFGKNDCTVFRKVMSSEDMIQEFAPALRTDAQAEALRIALQVLGDLTGFGLDYFDYDEGGHGVKTATEVSSENSCLMRNIARHEHALEVSLAGISRAFLHCARAFGEGLPDEGSVSVNFDDSIVTDTAAEKKLDMAEVGVTLCPWEYRMKWMGEDEATARARVVAAQPETACAWRCRWPRVGGRKVFTAAGAGAFPVRDGFCRERHQAHARQRITRAACVRYRERRQAHARSASG